MSYFRYRRSTLATAVVLGGALLVSGCSSSPEEPESQQSQTEAATADATTEAATEAATATGSATDGATGAPAGEQTEVAIGETIDDTDMGDTIEVVSAVRDFPSEEQAQVIDDGGEIVLLEVTVTPGDEYGGLISMGNFEISWDEGADFWNNQTRMIEDEMTAAGFTPFEDVSRRDGGEHTGWIAFFPQERADTYLLQYTRSGAEVINSDETIDEFTTELEIPAP